VFDVFPVNVLRDEFLDQISSAGSLRAALSSFGDIETVGGGVSILAVDGEEDRSTASSFLEGLGYVVAAHADGQMSQSRPPG
jgi:hypothetical protein